LDAPDRQRLEALLWNPSQHGHVAFVGGPGSGAARALELTVRKLLAGPCDAHFYVLDATGSFLPFAGAARTGAYAGLHELRHAVRILERLVLELARRLSNRKSPQTPLIVVLAGWGSWASALRSGPLAWAEDLVHDLARDGAGAGITVLFSGERELVTARFFGTLPNRFYFPAHSSEETRALWPRMPAIPSIAGRAVAFGPVAPGGPAVCQFYRTQEADPAGGVYSGGPPPSSFPFRVEPLPSKITVQQVAVLAEAAPQQPPPAQDPSNRGVPASTNQPPRNVCAERQRGVLLGVAGDEPTAAFLRMPAGGVVAVLGNPGSGKSNLLRAMEQLNPAQQWCRPPVLPDVAGDFWQDMLVLAGKGGISPNTVLLVDDVDVLPQATVRALGELDALGFSLVVTAAFSPMLIQRVPLMMNARASGAGLLLGPRSMADGDLFGIRFEVESGAPPGRAVLVSGGRSFPLQVALAETRQ
ncbi:MAG: hypothetical protein ACLGH7_07905, partial [Actinomycetes bacterium]